MFSTPSPETRAGVFHLRALSCDLPLFALFTTKVNSSMRTRSQPKKKKKTGPLQSFSLENNNPRTIRCPYDDCRHGYTNLNRGLKKTENEHVQRYHTDDPFRITHHGAFYGVNRDPAKRMTYSCICNATFAYAYSLQVHIKGNQRRQPCDVIKKHALDIMKENKTLHSPFLTFQPADVLTTADNPKSPKTRSSGFRTSKINKKTAEIPKEKTRLTNIVATCYTDKNISSNNEGTQVINFDIDKDVYHGLTSIDNGVQEQQPYVNFLDCLEEALEAMSRLQTQLLKLQEGHANTKQ